jgi:tripartite-type tricarboxylate transporter receptor subunit TctC
LSTVLAIVLAGLSPGPADNYPSGPIRLLVPVAPGAINDLVARIVGEAITV